MELEQSALSAFLKKLYKLKPLTWDEEAKLAIRIKAGDLYAKDELVERNLRFVPYVVKQTPSWVYGPIPMEDLIAAGYEAMMTAAEKWEPQPGIKFVGFARLFIERAVIRYVEKHGFVIRLPSNVHEQIRKIKYIEMILTQQLLRDPTIDEISESTGISVKQIRKVTNYMGIQPASLDTINTEHLDTFEKDEQ